MRYGELADYYERLEATAKKLEKRDILAELYKKTDDLSKVVLLSAGTVFPAGGQELGIAREMMQRVIKKTYGIDDAARKFKETGDLGSTAEFFARHRKQRMLGKKELTVGHVFENLRKLPEITGSGSQERKIALVNELLSHSSPKEARYIVRTIIGGMRIGVAAGIVRDAVAKAFDKEVKEIGHAYDVIGDYGRVAEMAKAGKLKAEIQLGRPVRVMLADSAPDLKTALEKYYAPTIEIKYDGFRIAIHKDGQGVKVFSRRLEDVTNQFPDIVQWSRDNIKARQCIVEGEVIAIDKDDRPMPFQVLSRRIQRKYDIEKMVKEIPIQVDLFDLIFYNGDSWMEIPLRNRWDKLKEITNKTKYFRLADHVETKDLKKAEEFYTRSLEMGQEGVIIKNLDAYYQPGRRVGFWLKVKPILETLDCVITEAIAGEGKRARWLGSFVLSIKDEKGDLVEIGRMASGTTEKELEELTKELEKLVVEEKGTTVKVRPKIVVEVGYEEIQKSPKYPSGYALRFPRLIRIRYDRSSEDIDNLKRLKQIYRLQRGRR